MSLDAPVGGFDDLVDEEQRKPVVGTEQAYQGMIFDVRRERVDLGGHGVVTREFVEHPGAVLILALRPIGGVDHVVLIRQYRHATGSFLWELPAGLLDVGGELPWVAAARELHEEVDLTAGRWDVLIDAYASPGASCEVYRVYLARDVAGSASRHVRVAEEAELRTLWVPLEEAYAAVLAGRLHNPGAMVGILAAWGSRQRGWSTLRPFDAAWPEAPGRR